MKSRYIFGTLFVTFGVGASPLFADSFTAITSSSTAAWGTARWNNAADATPYTSSFTANNNVQFNNTSGYTFLTGIGSGTSNIGNVTLADGVVVNFTGTTAGTYATGGAVRTLTIGNGSIYDLASQSISTAAGTGFIKSGAGTLAIIGGAYTGGFTLNAGNVIARGVNAMGSGGSLTINGGNITANGTRDFTGKFAGGITIGGDFMLGGAATANSANASATANLTFSNTVGLGAATRTITIGANGIYALNGALSGSAGTGLTVAASSGATGTLLLGGANTYSGPTAVNGGILQLAKQVSLYNNVTANWTASNVVVSSGATLALNVGGTGEFTSGDVDTLKALGTGTGGFKSGSVLALDTTNAGGSFSYSSNIGNTNGGSDSLGFSKLGTGTLVLSGNNSFTGQLTVAAGTLSIGSINNASANGVLGNSSGAVNLAGTLQYTGGTASSNKGFAVTAATFQVDTSGATLGLSGAITGTGGVSKAGVGTLSLSGSNSYAGQTNVTAGTLEMTGGTNSGGGTLLLTGTSAFNMSGGTYTITGTNFVTLGNAAGHVTTMSVSGGTVSLTGSGGFNVGNSTSAGTLTVSGTGRIEVQSTTNNLFLAKNGAATAIVNLDGGSISTAAVGQGDGTATTGTSTFNFNGGTLEARTGGGTQNANFMTGLTNVFVKAGGAKIDSNGVNVAIAQVLKHDTGLGATPDGGLTKSGSGILTLSGVNTYTGATLISGGTLKLDATGTISTTSGLSLGTAGTFDVSAKGGPGYTVNNLSGSGTVVGTLTISTSLAIGNSPGTVAFDNLTVAGTSASTFEVNDVGDATDLANVSGTLTIVNGAVLDLVQLGTFTLGEKFTLFGYNNGSLTNGLFTDVNATVLNDGDYFADAGGFWQIDYDDLTAGLNGGTGDRFITVTAVPEPSVALLGALGALAMLRRRR